MNPDSPTPAAEDRRDAPAPTAAGEPAVSPPAAGDPAPHQADAAEPADAAAASTVAAQAADPAESTAGAADPAEATAEAADPAEGAEDAERHAERAYERARLLAEHGDLHEAARIFGSVLDLGRTAYYSRAALGLAVISAELGEPDRARAADELAIAAGEPEYSARAAYHLALTWEDAGDSERAVAAWQRVVALADPGYAPAARLALAQHAQAAGDLDTAVAHWRAAIEGGDPRAAALAADQLGTHLLERDDAQGAGEVFAAALTADSARLPELAAQLRVGLAIAHIESAVGALRGALDSATGHPGGTDHGTAEIIPLAVELLARLLPLRGRTGDAAAVWDHGLRHPDPRVAGAVRERLRRDLDPRVPGATSAEASPGWWEGVVESAVAGGRVAVLAGEALDALDEVIGLLAAPATRHSRRIPADLREALERAVSVPARYPWGDALLDALAERLGPGVGEGTEGPAAAHAATPADGR